MQMYMILITVICLASLARVDCVADKSKLMNESYIFSMKDPLVCTHFCPQNTGERILGLWKFKFFSEGACPQTPLEEGD